MPASDADETAARARRVALSVSWLAYATYYLGRKGFSVIKKPLERELGVSPAALGGIDTAFLAAYTFGQFGSGLLGDRVGARRLVGYGMLASALACAAFGLSGGALAFGACFLVNGLAQSTGWPGTTRVVAEWTTRENRGMVMGLWCTCYQVGGLAATLLAGQLAARYGWRSALLVPAVPLALVGLVVLVWLPRAPILAPVPVTARDGALVTGVPTVGRAQLDVLKSPTLWLFGASYFFIKLVRYALLFWLPYYLATAQGYSTATAAKVSMAFDGGGILGVILIGRLADRARRLSRPAWCALSIGLLVPVLGAYSTLSFSSWLVDVLLLAFAGALLFGPDSLLSGAAAQDAGGPAAAATATGFVNGLGSFGALLQGLIVPPIAARFGWMALFPVLAVFSIGAVVALLPTLRAPIPAPRA
jgi:sugar phosphate permease